MSKKVTPSDVAAVPGQIDELTVPGETDTPQVRIGAGSVLTLASQIVRLGTSFLIGIMVSRTLGVVGKGQLYAIMTPAPSGRLAELDRPRAAPRPDLPPPDAALQMHCRREYDAVATNPWYQQRAQKALPAIEP